MFEIKRYTREKDYNVFWNVKIRTSAVCRLCSYVRRARIRCTVNLMYKYFSIVTTLYYMYIALGRITTSSSWTLVAALSSSRTKYIIYIHLMHMCDVGVCIKNERNWRIDVWCRIVIQSVHFQWYRYYAVI